LRSAQIPRCEKKKGKTAKHRGNGGIRVGQEEKKVKGPALARCREKNATTGGAPKGR